MNNNFFALTRYLRERGVDAHLLLMTEMDHFQPYADTFSLDYMNYTRQLSWDYHGMPSILDFPEEKIREDIKDFDFIFGCGYVPAYLNKAGRRLDAFVPYGSDLYKAPFLRFGRIPNKRSFALRAMGKNQNSGIEGARYICEINPEFAPVYKKMKIRAERIRVGCPFIYMPEFSPEKVTEYYDQSHWYKEMRKAKDEFDFIIFHHTRHSWKNSPNEWSYKANDQLLNGLAEFIKKNPNVNPGLVTLEYGNDVQTSKDLIKELGIGKNVRWLPKMQRKDIMVCLSMVDVGATDFGLSWITGGTHYEFLSMGIPQIVFRDKESEEKSSFKELYPILNAKTGSQICGALEAFVADPEKYKEMGRQGREWYRKYAVEEPLTTFMSLMEKSA